MWRLALMVVLMAFGFLISSGLKVIRASEGRTYSAVAAVPHRSVGLLLGCSRRVPGGGENRFFTTRLTAAAQLFHAGKIDYIIVSGDNHVSSYDEARDMKDALVAAGVPAARIYPDFAGFRTLDSVVRAKEVFGQTQITIISQKFHNQRAIYLATNLGIDAIGYNARNVSLQYSLGTLLREQFARAKTVLDVTFRKEPRFLGPEVRVGIDPPPEATAASRH
jgi:SanA protein